MKYVLTHEERRITPRGSNKGVALYRIVALKDFTVSALKIIYSEDGEPIDCVIENKLIQVGQLGGFVQSERNLSQTGTCWVDDNAIACGNSIVKDDAYLGGNALIDDKVVLCDNAKVSDEIQIGGEIRFVGNTKVIGVGAYKDKGTFEGAFTGQRNIKRAPKPTAPELNSPPQNIVKVEGQVNGKTFSMVHEF